MPIHARRLIHRRPLDVDAWDWRVDARCRNEDPAIFFHPDGERGRARKRRDQKAKSVCARCAVLSECRAHSLAFQEMFGTWGGLTEEERGRLLAGQTDNVDTHLDAS
jgi:WhiB family transcriptional regulator, redox-sensing transcriptional regulator